MCVMNPHLELRRLQELHIRDMALLAGCEKPTLIALYQDHREQKHVKVREPSQIVIPVAGVVGCAGFVLIVVFVVSLLFFIRVLA